MGLHYENLDDQTRRFMLEEIEIDVSDGSVYVSSYLNDNGRHKWSDLLLEAATDGTDDSLADALSRGGCLKHMTERRKPKGFGTIMVRVPHNAHETLGEGQFNMYYTRALCRRATQDGIAEVEVYRAKAVAEPRPESERLIGTRLSAEAILNDLRSTKAVESALGLARPNSGLTIRLLR